MLARNLQIQFSDQARRTVFIPPSHLYCIRLTARTLEFLYATANGTPRFIILRGTRLGVLRRSILNGAVHAIAPGPFPPCGTIDSITDESLSSLAKEPMAPDPNPVPKHCLQFETGLARDLWSHAHLAVFALPRGREGQFLFQFRGEYAYVCTPLPGKFPAMVAEFKKCNLDPGMVNKISAVAAPLPNLPGVAHDRFPMAEIKFNHRNYAGESRWEVAMDFRGLPPPRPRMAMTI